MAAWAQSTSTRQSMTLQAWPPRLYLAIDCGGTKAAATVCNEYGEVVGRGHGGPSNYTDNGLLPFLASVEEAVKSALEDARGHYGDSAQFEWRRPPTPCADESDDRKSTQSPFTIADALASIKPSNLPHDAPAPRIEAAWLGIAGVDSPVDVTTLSPHIGTLLSIPCPSHRLIVANDTSLLASPIADSNRPEIKSGVVAIAGTGSIVMSFRRKRNGMLKVLGRVGGFGWLLGDEGSGYSVGRSAVRKVLDLADRERLSIEKGSGEEADELDSEEEDNLSGRDNAELRGDHDRYDDPATFEMDGAHNTTEEYSIMSPTPAECSGHTTTAETPSSPPPSARIATSEEALTAHSSKPPYGHLLRDRILQHWGLLSTDDLLRAVYFDDLPATTAGRPVPTANCVVSVTDTSNLSRSDNTLRPGLQGPPSPPTALTATENFDTTEATRHTALHLPANEASASLLPPTAPPLDAETRMRGASPIPSLSSSPSPSSVTGSDASSVGRSPAFRRTNSSQRTMSSHRTRSDSALATEVTSAASSFSTASGGGSQPRATLERKHRLASLAPLVFHLAFSHGDALSLEILRSQARFMALQIREILRPEPRAKAHLDTGSSVLCLGGSLVGVQRYRDLLVEQLGLLGIAFVRVEFVGDPAKRGAVALSHVMERSRTQQERPAQKTSMGARNDS